MAEYRKKIVTLSKGQLAKDLIERTDLPILDSSGQTVNNFQSSKYGLFGTIPSTEFCAQLGVSLFDDAKYCYRAFKLALSDGADVLLVVKAEFSSLVASWQNTLFVFSSEGKQLSVHYPTESLFNRDNLPTTKVIQNNDSIIVVSRGNPLYQLSLSDTGAITKFERYQIDLTKVVKVATLEKSAVNPVFFRLNTDTLPEDPVSLGIGDGDYVEINASGVPATPTGNINQLRISSDGTVSWRSLSYTPASGDYCKNFDNVYYIYLNGNWSQVTSYDDTHYGNSWSVNAVSGYVVVTVNGGIVISKPSYYVGTPQQFAERLFIGCDFDGEDNIGFLRIDKIVGVTEGNNYRINQIKGSTWISMLTASTYTGFTVKLGMKPAFDTDRPGTVDNIFNTTNYPLNAFFFQQRLFLAGTELDTTQLVASQVGTYNDFSNDYSGASTNAFQLEMAGTGKEVIQNIVINQGLQIFTDKGEWLVSDTAVTNKSGFLRNSTIGSVAVEPVIGANGITLFTPKQGYGLVGFVYNYETASFNTPTISILTDVFDSKTNTMSMKNSFSANDDTFIYITLEDGTLVRANYLRDQDIQSFVTSKNDAEKYIQALQVGETMFVMTRLANGNVVLEKETDAGVSLCHFKPYKNSMGWIYGLTSGVFPTKAGDLICIYDGNGTLILETEVPESGMIKLDEILGEAPADVPEVGFPIDCEFESNPINHSAETFGAYKTLRSIKIALTSDSNPKGLTVNGKHGVVKMVDGTPFVTFSHLTKPTRECVFRIKNHGYKVRIMSMTLEYSI